MGTKRFIIAPTTILILVLLLIPLSPDCSSSSNTSSPISLMENYLLHNYNHYLHLVSESPNANPGVYWLYTDNFLASLALQDSHTDISNAICESIETHQISTQDKFQVLLGNSIDNNLLTQGTTWNDVQTYGTRVVRIEITDTNVNMSDWQEYVDRLLLAVINYANHDEQEQALQLFNLASDMYDGVGFSDKCFKSDGWYSTFKLALYLTAASRLDITLPERDSIVNTILKLQDTDISSNRYGGIYTDYTYDRKPLSHCDTNTETTSLCLIALKTQE